MVAALSPNRAADFMQCPLLYRFRVIDKLPSPPSAAAARGTLVHAVLERLFDLPSSARTIEAAAAMVEPQWQALLEGRPELADLVEDSDPAAVASWFGDAVSLIERWFTLEDPTRLEPAERELYVETDLDGLTLRGYVDRLDVASTGEVRVVDYKTGRSPSELFEGKALFQMKFYALVLWRLRGQVPQMLQLVYLANSEIVRYSPTRRTCSRSNASSRPCGMPSRPQPRPVTGGRASPDSATGATTVPCVRRGVALPHPCPSVRLSLLLTRTQWLPSFPRITRFGACRCHSPSDHQALTTARSGESCIGRTPTSTARP